MGAGAALYIRGGDFSSGGGRVPCAALPLRVRSALGLPYQGRQGISSAFRALQTNILGLLALGGGGLPHQEGKR